MTKRLQVLFDDDELADIQRLAKDQRKTTAAWVRDALRAARAEETYPEPGPKLHAIREALTYAYPTGDIGDVLADIERGYADAHLDAHGKKHGDAHRKKRGGTSR